MTMDAPPSGCNGATSRPRGPVRAAVELAVDVVGRPAAEAVKPAVVAFKDAYPRGATVVDDVTRSVGGAADRVTNAADEAIVTQMERAQAARADAERAAAATKENITRRSRAVVDAAAAELSAEEVTRVSSTGAAFLSALATAVAHLAHRGLDVADGAADALSIPRRDAAATGAPPPGPTGMPGADGSVAARLAPEPSYAAVVADGPAAAYPSESARLARRALALATRLAAAAGTKYSAVETARQGTAVGGAMRVARDAASVVGGVLGGAAARASTYNGIGGPLVRGVAAAVEEVVRAPAAAAMPAASAPTETAGEEAAATTPVPPPGMTADDGRAGESIGVMDLGGSAGSLSAMDDLTAADSSIVA